MRSCLTRIAAVLVLTAASVASAEERFPPPEFRTDYQIPQTQVERGRSLAMQIVDVGVLAAALGVASYLAFKKRSRTGMFLVAVFSIAYFGFYREGCVCPVGSFQNVAMAAGSRKFNLSWVIGAIFLLPLLFSLFFGRIFCSGVCPLGAVQDVVIWKPVQVPWWIESALSLLAFAYVGLAVLFAWMGSDFIVCRYDPFVGFFRLSGTAHMLLIGAALLLIGLFVGRPYCRFFCPYGVLLKLLAPLSKRRVSITPTDCIDCRLCEQSCPFGAIRHPTPQRSVHIVERDRRRLAILLAILPVLIAAFAAVGYRSGPTLARVDLNVQIASILKANADGKVPDTANEVVAFRNSGQVADDVYAKADSIQKSYKTGGAFFGAWMGLVVGMKLINASIRRTSREYTADASSCLACARCFRYCPNDTPNLQKPVPVAEVAPVA